MSNKLRFSLIFTSAAMMLFTLSACELQGTCDPDVDPNGCQSTNTGTDTNRPGTDTNRPGTDTQTTGPGPCGDFGCLDYNFIRIDDLSDQTTGEDPGADIDAVVLVKGSRRIFAYEASQYSAAQAVRAGDTNEMLGAPDAFVAYPTDTTSCNLYKADTNPTYTSLGGLGGYAIVKVPEKIEAGDQIQVLEVGNCEFESQDNPGTFGEAKAEPIRIQVSVSDDVNGNWIVVSDRGEGPVITATVPSLPDVPAN